MHTVTMRHEVLTLLESGLSQRKVSALLGVSRGYVQNVRHGRYHEQREEEFVYPGGGFARCPTCGGLVMMPCLLCGVLEHERLQLR